MKNNRVYIIAEIGPNHNGSFKNARKMISLLKNSGVNAIKFQLADPDSVYSDNAFLANYQKKNGEKSIKEMSIKNQLSHDQHLKLSKICKKNKIDYLCSAFDKKSLEFLIKKIKIPIIKIPSGEITSIDILNYISKQKKKILLSTGMSNLDDIKKAMRLLNKNFKKKITLLHCVSSYPAPKKILNLNIMKKLKEIFDVNIGYSDHSTGHEACLAAVAAGATVIEKHVTLSTNLKGPDHKSSMEIKQFKLLVKKIRNLEIILGNTEKKVLRFEQEIQKVARKSIVSSTFLRKGTIINKKHIVFKRPGTGISPFLINKIIGKKVINNVKKNRVLKLRNIK